MKSTCKLLFVAQFVLSIPSASGLLNLRKVFEKEEDFTIGEGNNPFKATIGASIGYIFQLKPNECNYTVEVDTGTLSIVSEPFTFSFNMISYTLPAQDLPYQPVHPGFHYTSGGGVTLTLSRSVPVPFGTATVDLSFIFERTHGNACCFSKWRVSMKLELTVNDPLGLVVLFEGSSDEVVVKDDLEIEHLANEACSETDIDGPVVGNSRNFHWGVVGNTGSWSSKSPECLADTATTNTISNLEGNKLGVMCCGSSGAGRRVGCLSGVTYEAAKAHCEASSLTLCTKAQILLGAAGWVTGCSIDAYMVWTSDPCEQWTIYGSDCPGNDIAHYNGLSTDACLQKCADEPLCKGVGRNMVPRSCWLKSISNCGRAEVNECPSNGHCFFAKKAPLQHRYVWVDDGCHTEDGKSDDIAGSFISEFESVAAARCCDDTSCTSPQSCPQRLTFAQASEVCTHAGRRLCTRDELLSEMCCGTGGNCDSHAVWTSLTVVLSVDACTWSKPLSGWYSSGFAGGVETQFSLVDAKHKCIELGHSTCKAVTCNFFSNKCTVRASSVLSNIHPEKTHLALNPWTSYLPAPCTKGRRLQGAVFV